MELSSGSATIRRTGTSATDALLLVGTTKGAFVVEAGSARSAWRVRGPYLKGSSVYAMAYDGRNGRQRIWAAARSEHWGPGLHWSDDLGESWHNPETPLVRFPSGSGLELRHIWQIAHGSASEADKLYCGVEPAALFESSDAGSTWTPVSGLLDHPHRALWQPGGGGLCLHTILPDPADPRRMLIAVSTGGVYRTDDGGRSWQPRNRGIRAEFLPDKYPELGQCVHKVVHHPSRPGRLFLQNHWGLYRSDDWGDSWHDIANGVPSDFGFAMLMHPRDPETVYIVPLESDMFRCTPEAKLRVYRTRNAGDTWEPLARGLPQKDAHELVLRDGMAADDLDPPGIYFGTRSGKLYGSRNGGSSWRLIADSLPPVVSVNAATVRRPAPVSSRGKSAARRRSARTASGSGAAARKGSSARRA